MSGLVFDCETTGKTDTDQVIELAYQRINLEDGEVSLHGAHCARYKPTVGIEFGAMGTHHIIPSDLANCEPHSPRELPEADFYIGHNVDFDAKFYAHARQGNRIDTLAMMRDLHPELDSHSLAACYYLISMDDLESARDIIKGAHAAAIDVAVTVGILQYCAKQYGASDLDELHFHSENARIPKVMSFGKHRGKPVSEVDNGWRRWYKGTPNPDLYLLKAFEIYPFKG